MTFETPSASAESRRWYPRRLLAPFRRSQSRGRERYRRAVLTTLSFGVARGIAVVTTLVTVPLALNYLGAERYGLWLTITSLVALVAFADLGMGSGLVNVVSAADGADDVEGARRYVSSAFFMLLAVSIVLSVVFAVAYWTVPWADLFNVSSERARADAGPAVAVVAVCFLVGIPLAIVERTQDAYQEGFVNGLWMAAGSVLGLVALIAAIWLEAGLPWLVLALLGPPLLMMVFNGVRLFWHRRPAVRPARRFVSAEASRRVLRVGFLFFVLQLAMAVAYATDNLVIARVLGSEAVTEYAVPARLFMIVPMILLLALRPLWPAYSEAIARNDAVWVKRTLAVSVGGAVAISALAAAVLVVFGRPIIHAWVGDSVTPSYSLLIGLGVWSVLSVAGTAVAMFLNGASVVRFQVIIASLMAVAALALKIVLANVVGLQGVVWGTVIAYVALSAIPVAIYVPRLVRSIGRSGPAAVLRLS
jgi:O-antigen/teichoic acid export membrane protein